VLNLANFLAETISLNWAREHITSQSRTENSGIVGIPS
jgi:hypothetical protein